MINISLSWQSYVRLSMLTNIGWRTDVPVCKYFVIIIKWYYNERREYVTRVNWDLTCGLSRWASPIKRRAHLEKVSSTSTCRIPRLCMVTLRRDENAREKKGRYMHPLLSVKYSYRRLDLRSVRLYFSFASLIVSKYTRLVPQKWTLKKKKRERERKKQERLFR